MLDTRTRIIHTIGTTATRRAQSALHILKRTRTLLRLENVAEERVP
jgi:hypothetical protein